MTKISPRNSGNEPSTSPAATIAPQVSTVCGFSAITRTEVVTATRRPTLRSSSRGNETTLTASTTTANRNPTAQPMTAIAQPGPVKITARTNSPTE